MALLLPIFTYYYLYNYIIITYYYFKKEFIITYYKNDR